MNQSLRNNLWWKIPLLVLGISSLVFFLVSTIVINKVTYQDGRTQYLDIDYYVSKVLGNLSKVLIIKYFSVFYFQIGNSQLYLALLLVFFVIVESIYAYKNTKEISWCKNKPKSIWIYYGCGILLWVIAAAVQAQQLIGPAINREVDMSFIISYYDEMWIFIALTIIESVILGFVIYYMRTNFTKRSDILVKEYWIRSVKVLAFGLVGYLVIAVIKQFTGRPEGVNAWFDSMVGTSDGNGNFTLSDEVLSLKNVDFNKFKDLITSSLANNKNTQWLPNKYFAWWEVNGSFSENFTKWWGINVLTGHNDSDVTTAGWAVRNFPSGHTYSTMIMAAFWFTFVNQKREEKYGWEVKTIFTVWFIHINLMMYTLVISRVHWYADVAFTGFLQIIFVYFMSWAAEYLSLISKARFRNKYKGVINRVFVSKVKDNYFYHLEMEGYMYFILTTKNHQEKVENKIVKRYKCEIVNKI